MKHLEEENVIKFLSEEKDFDQNQNVKRWNDRLLCKDSSDISTVCTHNPLHCRGFPVCQ